MGIRKHMSTAVVVVLATSLWIGSAWAAFEDIEVSPRSRGMGTAYVATDLDAWAAYHNPASLAWADEIRAAAAYVRPFGFDFSSQSTAAAVTGIGRFGGIAMAVRHFGVEFGGEDLTRENTFTLAHGFKLLEDVQSTVSFGWALNVYNLSFGSTVGGIDPGSATVVGLDVAAQAVVQERTRIGFYATNVNNPRIGDVDKEELIRRVGVGAAYTPYRGVTTMFDISDQQGDPVQFRGGAEFAIDEYFLLRGGLHTNPDVFTFGAGFRWRGLNIDYGFSSSGGVLENTHQFGIEYVFPKDQ